MNETIITTKNLTEELSKRIERSTDDVNILIEGFSTILKDTCGELGTIAIPGFGKFSGIKQLEHIDTTEDGRRILVPPRIFIQFAPSTILKNRISEKGASDGI